MGKTGTVLLNKTMPGENIPFRIKDGGEATSHSSTHAAQFSRQAEETEFRKSKRSQPLSPTDAQLFPFITRAFQQAGKQGSLQQTGAQLIKSCAPPAGDRPSPGPGSALTINN